MENMSWQKILRRSSQRQSPQYDELAQLEAQFRNAYVMKELDAQLAEKKANKMARVNEEKLSLKLIALEQVKLIDEDTRRSLEVSRSRTAYKKVLEEQIASKVEVKRQVDAIEREERKLLGEVDKLTDKFFELAKQKRHNDNLKRIKYERLLFEELREIKKAIKAQDDAIAAERDRIYLEKIDQRTRELKKHQAEKVKRREELIEAVARLFVDATLEKCKREAVIGDLVAEEIRHAAIIEKRECAEKAKVKRKEYAADLMDQMLFTAECETRARERDRIFAKELLTRLMIEDKRLNQLTIEAKKRKQQQYKEDLEKLIDERERLREEALMQAQAELNESRAMDEAKRQRIKIERRRLIEQHAGNVALYLRHGVLTKDEENIVKKLLEKCKQSLI